MTTDRAGLLISVKPEWARKILPLARGAEPVGDEGTKNVELRRVTPVDLVPGMPIVLHLTGTGIVGEAEVSTAHAGTVDGLLRHWVGFGSHAAMGREDAASYWAGASSPCAIWLRGARRYPRPIPLEGVELRITKSRDPWCVLCLRPPQSFRYLTADQLAAIRREAGDDDG